MLIIVGERRLEVGLEFLGDVNVLADLTVSAVDRLGHLREDVVSHLVVVCQREHRHRVGIPQLQRDSLTLEVGNDLLERVTDLRVVGEHRSGGVQAQDDVTARRLVVLGVAVDGRTRGNRRRDDGDDKADHSHR